MHKTSTRPTGIVLTGGRPDGEFSMDIAAAKGTRIIADARMPTGPKRAPFRLSFDLLEETPAIEVRLHAGGSHRIAVKEVQLEKRGP